MHNYRNHRLFDGEQGIRLLEGRNSGKRGDRNSDLAKEDFEKNVKKNKSYAQFENSVWNKDITIPIKILSWCPSSRWSA